MSHGSFPSWKVGALAPFVLALSTLFSPRASAQKLTITTFAGAAVEKGSIDGTGGEARFYSPPGVAMDGSGNLYVADGGNNTIRRIRPGGSVTTLAGLDGSPGSSDGAGSTARFDGPSGVAADGLGNVFVADTNNHTIRKIVVATGAVTTLAGSSGQAGNTNGTGPAARFYQPFGLAADASGNVYVAEPAYNTIRKIVVATGEVTALAGWPGLKGTSDGKGMAAQFNGPRGVAADGSGNLYVADTGNHTIRQIVLTTAVVSTVAGLARTSGSADGTGTAALFAGPSGVAADGSGNVYVADTGNSTIRRMVAATKVVTTLAGQPGSTGGSDGTGIAARFNLPTGVTVGGSGDVYVADRASDTIRKVTAGGVVTTWAGLWGGSRTGSSDGTGSQARFHTPYGAAADGSGNVFIADSENHVIRKITPEGAVTTFAGTAGSPGLVDGTGSAARFNFPISVAVDGSGNVFVADSENRTTRKITPDGVVTTFAGSPADFYAPSAIAADKAGNVFVADLGNHTIKMITPAGVLSTLAGRVNSAGSLDGVGSLARFNHPRGVAADGSGNLYVADNDNHTIRKIVVASGLVSTLAGSAGNSGSADGTGSAARFNHPWGLTVDSSGSLYVVDGENLTIRRITIAGVVTTVAGSPGNRGFADGTGSDARFDMPSGIAAAGGKIYIADTTNAAIRIGRPALADVATIDAATGPTGGIRLLDTAPRTATRWLWEEVRRPTNSMADLSSTTIRNPTFAPDVPDVYVFRLTASDESGLQTISTVTLTATVPAGGPALSRLLPTVIDVSSGSIHYTTEMALTNNTFRALSLSMLYTASLGSRRGSGTVIDALAPGEQRAIPDVLSYLRDKGLAIPPSAEQPSQGGTLLVTFQGNDTIDPKLVSVTARTAALTTAPQPAGRAGLAYSGLLATESSTSSVTLYGLRSTSTDRTNVAVFNTSAQEVTLRVTVTSGSGDGKSVVFKAAETLPAYGWLQYGSAQILDVNGIAKGWVTIERTSTTGSFSAYAVINDFATNDGSFVLPVGDAVTGSTLTVPVLSETPQFRSELILANRSASAATLTLDYVEALTPGSGVGGSIPVTLAPFDEQIIPEAVDYLRTNGVNIGAKDAAPYVGALRVTVSGSSAQNVFAGARTASQSLAGGQFGLFTPCVYGGQEASAEAYLYGLRADSENRTNVAVVNAGSDSAGPILLQLQAYDGDAGGVPKGDPVSVPLAPGQWAQPANFFKNSGVANGWVKVTRMSGTAPWIAYAVVNDGGKAGERTGDGAYVPM